MPLQTGAIDSILARYCSMADSVTDQSEVYVLALGVRADGT
jgi:hypothetical protein